ncbi:MAG: non-canonical purine NTP pyrophosphatase [Prosthecobacter sp.]|nr:non-canonical purine NTP pyrophosphatase [Prosthecobacter sp.]
MPRLFLATSNSHKTNEVAAILGPKWQVEDMLAHPGMTLPEETGDTFEANAVIKAQGASASLPGAWVLADDSGLEVDVLAGAPGVQSARYAGPGANDAENRTKLKNEMRALAANPGQSFPGRFHCCMALVRDGKLLHVTHGTVEGKLLLREQGTGGFGYDPLFVPQGHKESFGVLPEAVKNSLSHRAAALAQMREWLDAHVHDA